MFLRHRKNFSSSPASRQNNKASISSQLNFDVVVIGGFIYAINMKKVQIKINKKKAKTLEFN
jgi:hypothetical protein